MPIVTRVDEIKLDWTDISGRCVHSTRDTETRAAGVHLSGIIRKIAVAKGILRRGQQREEEFPLRMAMGMAWEAWVVGLYPDTVWQPGELELDGISGNPDGYSVHDDEPMIEEFKLTWKKRKIDVLDEWMWLTQMVGYCKMSGNGCRHARLHVCWVNDMYSPPQPVYYTYYIEWTQEEVDSTWKLLLLNKEGTVEE